MINIYNKIYFLSLRWYKQCTIAHLTGLQTDTKKDIGEKQIFYREVGDSSYNYNERFKSWAGAEMLLLPKLP